MSEQQSVISPPQNSEDMALHANEEGLDVDFEGMVREEEALEQEEIPDQEEQARQGAVSGNSKDLATIPKVGDLLKNAEGTAPRAARAPKLPSAREIEDHELTHCPPRSWCDHCVRGQYKDERHLQIKGELAESSVVRVSLDYTYLTEDVKGVEADHEKGETAKTSMAVLVMVETLCRSVWGYACETKGGSEEWVVDQVVEDIETIGLASERIIIKGDQESSLTDLQRQIAKARCGYGSALESSRVGDSNSNGRVERAIQDLCGLVRTLRSCLEEKVGGKIHLNDLVVPWIVRHAGHLITMCRIREDGRTAYQLMKGRRTNAKLVMFGEFFLSKSPRRSNEYENSRIHRNSDAGYDL